MRTHPTDISLMQQALDLASQGIGLTSPNPAVGALVVEGDDKIIGRGTHTYEGASRPERVERRPLERVRGVIRRTRGSDVIPERSLFLLIGRLVSSRFQVMADRIPRAQA